MTDKVGSGVFRAPLRSRRDDVVFDETFERALRLRVCGIGGVLDEAPETLDEAIFATALRYDERTARRLQRFARVPDGSFVWTKQEERFLLGRIAGSWRYDESRDAARVDLVHVRRCEWLDEPFPESGTPIAVTATFSRGGRNFQEIHSVDILDRTRDLWDLHLR